MKKKRRDSKPISIRRDTRHTRPGGKAAETALSELAEARRTRSASAPAASRRATRGAGTTRAR